MPPLEASARTGRENPDVERLLDGLDHPLNEEIRVLRAVILGADPAIREEVKWNAPSFATTAHFATFHLRARDAVQIVFHRGAKVRADGTERLPVADPDGLLQWRDRDRAVATFREGAEVERTRDALGALVRAWIAYV